MTFERATNENIFKDEQSFCQGFLRKLADALKGVGHEQAYCEAWLDEDVKNFEILGEHVTKLCEHDKVVLMIDEVDQASNNLLFLGFLSMLRSKYLARNEELDFTFHSVILASVYDIKNIRLKMINEGLHTPTQTDGSWFFDITRTGIFDMEMCLERFQVHWQEIANLRNAEFLEEQCRMIFLTYLKPLLNGYGFYFIESELTDDRRMDLVVTYGNERFIIELKIWRGRAYHQKDVEQLMGYMDNYNAKKGYLLTFDFRKNPEPQAPQWTHHENREIFEVRVSN